MKRAEKIAEAAKILKKHEIKSLSLGRFGTYRQYEVAGNIINFYLLDECELEEDICEELAELLSFIDEDFIDRKLGFPNEGQNKLLIDDEGNFSYETFSI